MCSRDYGRKLILAIAKFYAKYLRRQPCCEAQNCLSKVQVLKLPNLKFQLRPVVDIVAKL